MDLTLHLHSWHLPFAITVGGMILTCLIARGESRTGGDFSVPLFSMAAALATVVASLVAWGMWAVMHFANLT